MLHIKPTTTPFSSLNVYLIRELCTSLVVGDYMSVPRYRETPTYISRHLSDTQNPEMLHQDLIPWSFVTYTVSIVPVRMSLSRQQKKIELGL